MARRGGASGFAATACSLGPGTLPVSGGEGHPAINWRMCSGRGAEVETPGPSTKKKPPTTAAIRAGTGYLGQALHVPKAKDLALAAELAVHPCFGPRPAGGGWRYG
jgi:hypothetical protein